MAEIKNRELSQFSSFLHIEDETESIGITTTIDTPYVGIGTTNATSKLHVVGNVLITGITTSSGGIKVSGPFYDSNNNVGTASSVLVSSGSGVNWTNPSVITTQGTAGSQGTTGSQGVQGGLSAQGTEGAQGATGTQGALGFGAQGISGTAASQGATGTQGSTGTSVQGSIGSGAQGTIGAQGISGIQGLTGTSIQGSSGTQGSTGTSVQGSTGAQGRIGTQGSTGTSIQGSSGTQGSTGTSIQGTSGSQGALGAQGSTGTSIQGTPGSQGSTGTSIQGTSGSQGALGAQGSAGTAGPSTTINATDTTSDATFYPVFIGNSGTNETARVRTTATAFTFNPSTGSLSAVDFNSASDINLKENIETVSNALEIISNLRGVKFNWKQNQLPSIGVIAQELEQVLPELVSQSDPKTVNYDGIIGVLIEAVKELSDKVNKS